MIPPFLMPKSFEARQPSPAPRPESRRGAKPLGRRDALEPRSIANDVDDASRASMPQPSAETRQRIEALRKSNEEHRVRRLAEAEAERQKAVEEAERLAAEEAAQRAEKAAQAKRRRENMSDAAKQDLREAAAKIRRAHRGMEKEKKADVGAAAKEISAYFLNAEALQAYTRDLAKVAETALETNELAMPDGRQFPTEWSMDDVRSLVGRLEIEVALKKEEKIRAEKRAQAIAGYDRYAKDYQARKEEREKMMEDLQAAGRELDAEGTVEQRRKRAEAEEAAAIDKGWDDVPEPAPRVESRRPGARSLVDDVEFAPNAEAESRQKRALEAKVRRLGEELETAKRDLVEARKAQSLSARAGAFLRRFAGGKPSAADEAMGELEAEVRMKENALEKAQRDLQDLRDKAAGGPVDLESAMYTRGEQAKMAAHDVMEAVAIAPEAWSKRSMDRKRAERHGLETTELGDDEFGGRSRVGMSAEDAEELYSLDEEGRNAKEQEKHAKFSETAGEVLGKEAVEKLMEELDRAAEILEARAEGGEREMQQAVEELGRMDFSPNRYAKLTADLYEAVRKSGPDRMAADRDVQRLKNEILEINELLKKGGALHGNPAERFFRQG